jgi:hypothetical protein
MLICTRLCISKAEEHTWGKHHCDIEKSGLFYCRSEMGHTCISEGVQRFAKIGTTQCTNPIRRFMWERRWTHLSCRTACSVITMSNIDLAGVLPDVLESNWVQQDLCPPRLRSWGLLLKQEGSPFALSCLDPLASLATLTSVLGAACEVH